MLNLCQTFSPVACLSTASTKHRDLRLVEDLAFSDSQCMMSDVARQQSFLYLGQTSTSEMPLAALERPSTVSTKTRPRLVCQNTRMARQQPTPSAAPFDKGVLHMHTHTPFIQLRMRTYTPQVDSGPSTYPAQPNPKHHALSKIHLVTLL